MNPTIKQWLTYGIAFIAIAVILILLLKSCDDKNVTPADEIKEIKEKPVTHYRDKDNIEHAEKPVVTADVSGINAFYDHVIDSLKKVIKAKDKDIKALAAASFSTTSTFTPVISYPDSSKAAIPAIEYSDKWLSIKGNAGGPWTYSVRDSLTFVAYTKRTGLFKKELMLNAYAQNPNTHIAGLTGISVYKEKPNRFGLGLQLGYHWTGEKFAPTIGVGLSYNLIKF